MNIHGTWPDSSRREGHIHFNTDYVHIKEWRHQFEDHINETIRESTDSFNTPPFKGPLFELNENGDYTLRYDSDLQ